MKKRLLLVVTLIAVLFSFSAAFAAIDKVPGVPKVSPFVYTVTFTPEQKASMLKYIDIIIKNPEFDKVTANFEKETGTAFPKGIFEKLNNVTNFSIAAVPGAKDMKEPAMAVLVTFDNDKLPAEVITKAKEKIAQIYKKKYANEELIFTDSEEEGIKVATAAPKDSTKDHSNGNDVKLLSFGNTVVMVAQKKSEAAHKTVITALKNEKETLASSDKFKLACESVGKGATSVLFFDGEAIKQLEPQKNMADLINFIALGGEVTGDLSKIATKAIISMNEVKDPAVKKGFDLAKKLIGGIKRASHPSEAMPADVVLFLDLKLNLTKELFDMPELAQVKPMLMMTGMNLEEDILSWFDGGIFVAVSDIVNPKEIKEKGLIPDVYLGLGCASAEKQVKFIEKLAAFLKNVSPNLEFKDETVANLKVKAIEVKGASVKDLVIIAGVIDKQFIIATSRKAFEKAAAVKVNLASNAEFKALGAIDATAFLSYFMNSEKLTKVAMELAPDASKIQKNDFAKNFLASASMVNNDIVGGMIITMDMSKMTPEFVTEQFKLMAEKMTKGNAPQAPVMEEKKGEEKPAEPKVEEKKGEATPDETKVEEKKDAPVEAPKGTVEKEEEGEKTGN